MIVDLDHIQIAAPPGSEDDAKRFYGDLLGLDAIRKPDELADRGGVWFSVGGQEVHIGIDPDFRPATKAHPAFRAADRTALDMLIRQLTEAGHPVEWDASLPNVDRCFVADPFGNRVELLTYT